MFLIMDLSTIKKLKKFSEKREKAVLSKLAVKSTEGIRKTVDASDDDELRPKFYRDADRILHSAAFSRYIDKTQVFYLFKNDHITHRMIHVQLLSKISRTIGRSLGLNEDLIEAIALGHDIGHAPFGHDGEEYLSQICQKYGINKFLHNVQSVIFLDQIENHGRGLNLTLQVIDGILCHDGETPNTHLTPNRHKDWNIHRLELNSKIKKGKDIDLRPMTYEGCVVKIADTISYIGRDIEDAITLKLIKRADLPADCVRILGDNNRKIIDTLVKDVIVYSLQNRTIGFSEPAADALTKLKDFNYQYIYLNKRIKTEADKIEKMFSFLFEHFMADLEKENRDSAIYRDFLDNIQNPAYLAQNKAEIVKDFIAGITDNYFYDCFKDIYLPKKFGYQMDAVAADL